MSIRQTMRWTALCLLMTTSAAWAATPAAEQRVERIEQRADTARQHADQAEARANRIEAASADASHPRLAQQRERGGQAKARAELQFNHSSAT